MTENVVSQMHDLLQEVVPILQASPCKRDDCKQIAEDLQMNMRPLLEDIRFKGAPMTAFIVDFLRNLKPEVITLKRLVERLKERSWIKQVFTPSLVGELSKSISKVRNSLRSLSHVHSRMERELREENQMLRNNLLLGDQRQVDQNVAIGVGNIVRRFELFNDLISRSKTVPILITECQLVTELADLVTGLDNQADAVAVRELGGIPVLVGLLEGSSATSTIAARTLFKMFQLDSESSPLLATTGGILVLCKMLQSSSSSTSFDNVAVLELLALASENRSNKEHIILCGGVPPLVTISSTGTTAVQEKALTTLLHLSREIPAEIAADIPGPQSEQLFVSALTKKEVCRCLLEIVTIRGESSPTERAVVMAVSLIRNVSLSGTTARMELMQEGQGAIRLLLARIRHHDPNSSVASPEVVRVSVVALERFITTAAKGRVAFIDDGGVEALTEVLTVGNSQTQGFAAKILSTLTEDQQVSREACNRILLAGTISHLKGMLESKHIEGQDQACLLLKNLLQGPSKLAVCTAIRGDSECIQKLLELNSGGHSGHAGANAVLEELKKDRQIKKQISNFKPKPSRSS